MERHYFRALVVLFCSIGQVTRAQNPHLILDIAPGEESIYAITPTVLNDMVLMSLWTPEHGLELWRTDGTGPGTYMVKNIYPGESSSLPGHLTTIGDHVYFSANDGVHGPELWKTDGTELGTVMVADVLPGPEGDAPSLICEGNGGVFFGNLILYWTDGTEAGTVQLGTLAMPEVYGGSRYTRPFAMVDNTMLFVGRTLEQSQELWRSDGTPAGTHLLKEFWEGTGGLNPGIPLTGWFNILRDELYFVAYVPDVYGLELWRSNGTLEGTQLVKDIF